MGPVSSLPLSHATSTSYRFCHLLLFHFETIAMPPLLHCFPFLIRTSCSTYFLSFTIIESISFLDFFFVSIIICIISHLARPLRFLESNYFFDITKLFVFFLEFFLLYMLIMCALFSSLKYGLSYFVIS